MSSENREIAQGVESSVLYVVATPIGNLGDVTGRALDVLQAVNLIAAEDTRHTGVLLNHFGINTQLISLHEHNEARRCASLVLRLKRGEAIALVSDAGTPLINDPGYHLVRAVRAAGFSVRAVPGVSAITAALSICGLSTSRFAFEGFLSNRAASRQSQLSKLVHEERTLVFFESPRRLLSTLDDMCNIFGEARQAAVVREISKRFEMVLTGSLRELGSKVRDDKNIQRGELVIVVDGGDGSHLQNLIDPLQLMIILAEYVPHRDASMLAARITGGKKNDFYRLLLEHMENSDA